MAKNKEQLMAEIQAVLSGLGTALEAHGGGVKLIDFDPATGCVSVRLVGACLGCPMSDLTLRHGIEEQLMESVPEVKQVIAV